MFCCSSDRYFVSFLSEALARQDVSYDPDTTFVGSLCCQKTSCDSGLFFSVLGK